MTDEAPKKAWARCPACSTVYPNIQIAKDGHKLNCPYDMKLKQQDLEGKVAALEQKILDLGGNLDEISADPGIDFTGVEDDESAAVDTDPAWTDDLPVSTVQPAIDREDDGWDDEEEDPAQVTSNINLAR